MVEAVGPDVTSLRPGDRIAYAGSLGAYATHRVLPADRALKLPDGIDARVAAAITLQGLTAEYLLHRTYVVKPGDRILVHAAAGGVGQLIVQWASHIGATVIGVVSSEAKAEAIRAQGRGARHHRHRHAGRRCKAHYGRRNGTGCVRQYRP